MEAEIKYRIPSTAALRERLLSYGYLSCGSSHQIDTYYLVNTKTGSLNHAYYRIRHDITQDTYTLTLKHETAHPDISAEDETIISSEQADMIHQINTKIFDTVTVVEKMRETYCHPAHTDILIVLDEVINLGSFVEIEIMTDHVTADTTDTLYKTAEQLDLPAQDQIPYTQGYPDLLLAAP